MHHLVADVLAAWREAERVASENAPGSDRHFEALAATVRLRALFAELTDSVATDGAPDAEAAATILADSRIHERVSDKRSKWA